MPIVESSSSSDEDILLAKGVETTALYWIFVFAVQGLGSNVLCACKISYASLVDYKIALESEEKPSRLKGPQSTQSNSSNASGGFDPNFRCFVCCLVIPKTHFNVKSAKVSIQKLLVEILNS